MLTLFINYCSTFFLPFALDILRNSNTSTALQYIKTFQESSELQKRRPIPIRRYIRTHTHTRYVSRTDIYTHAHTHVAIAN